MTYCFLNRDNNFWVIILSISHKIISANAYWAFTLSVDFSDPCFLCMILIYSICSFMVKYYTKKWSFLLRNSSLNVTKSAALRIWSLKKFLMKNFILCAVKYITGWWLNDGILVAEIRVTIKFRLKFGVNKNSVFRLAFSKSDRNIYKSVKHWYQNRNKLKILFT